MNVEVNETNIDVFALTELTGNSREDLLSRAAEASMQGYVLTVRLPDNMLSLNIFDHAESTPVADEPEPDVETVDGEVLADLTTELDCLFTSVTDRDGSSVGLCVVHNAPQNGATGLCTNVKPL